MPNGWRQHHAQLGFEHWVLDGSPSPKMVGFCDLLGTPYAPVSKIAPVKGPSINDVSPKGEGGGYKKCPKSRRSLVDLRRQGEGGYPQNVKFGETSFMDGPLCGTQFSILRCEPYRLEA